MIRSGMSTHDQLFTAFSIRMEKCIVEEGQLSEEEYIRTKVVGK